MSVLLGFDPGGRNAFGWCVVEDAPALPLAIRTTGVANSAEQAVAEALAGVAPHETVAAAGIDAPLFWVPHGGRLVDQAVRDATRRAGGSGRTVQSVNSLRGACLVQGILAGILLRRQHPTLPLSEAHPKAYLWINGLVHRHRPMATVTLRELAEFHANGVGGVEHVRDAALAALSAWALVRRPLGWTDLYLQELNPVSPVSAPLSYWMRM
jgi:hypothetical protein